MKSGEWPPVQLSNSCVAFLCGVARPRATAAEGGRRYTGSELGAYLTTVTSDTAIMQPTVIIVSSAVIIALIFASSSTIEIMIGSSLDSPSD